MNQDKIGNLIKSLRQENNLTQKELADKLGVTYQAVSKWETGKNIPDIGILKQISEEFNVNIDELLNGERKFKKKKKSNFLIKFIPVLFVALGVLIIEILNSNAHKDDFEFKTISSKCNDFVINGSAAYNKEKATIYISSIEFCGKEDTKEYKTITCSLYETQDNVKTKISDCDEGKDTNLEDYLKNVNIKVDHYSKTCRNLSKNTLSLEILARDNDNQIRTYIIPIKLSDKC